VPEAGEFFALKECQTLLKQRLTKRLLKLFHELTGLRVHALWQTPIELLHPDERPLACPTAPKRCDGVDKTAPMCRRCQQLRWRVGTQTDSDARRFRGECGLTNFCAAVHAGTNCPLKLVLQARVTDATAPSRESPRRASGKSARSPGADEHQTTNPEQPIAGEARASNPREVRGAKHAIRGLTKPEAPATVSAATFNRAVALLGVIRHDLQTTVHGEMARAELERSRRRLKDVECEHARLRAELHGRISEFPAFEAQPAPGSHAQQLVQAMLDYIRQNSSHPVCLDAMATALRASPAYLSRLFSADMGVTFHQYLDEFRLARARELLRDPRNRVAEVASAAGYASADYFRHAFKAHASVSPSAWRQGH
jgi:AraC-like DNA-binding protein